MELRRLRYFLSVASAGSLSAAARDAAVAQPALTRQMQLLEGELGVPLFERTARGMTLTDEGRYLKEALETPLQEITSALRNVSSYTREFSATLAFGMPSAVAQSFGPGLLRRLRAELPNLKLRIVEGESGRLASDLGARLLDVAILLAVSPEQRVFSNPVFVEPVWFVAAASSPLARRGPVRFRDLQDAPLILPTVQSGFRTVLAKLAAAHDVKIDPAIEVDSLELTKRLVLDGSAATLLPEPAFRTEREAATLVAAPIVEPDLRQPVVWAIKPEWRLPRSVYNSLERIVFEELRDAVQSGAWPGEWVFDLNLLSLPLRAPGDRVSADAPSKRLQPGDGRAVTAD